jgi:secondary thiamine-phosphate synthase enzyme
LGQFITAPFLITEKNMWIQKEFYLPEKKRGYHLITDDLISEIPELRQIRTGILHIFIKHTSASLTINENADPTVRMDFETHFNKSVPDNAPYYKHDSEGPDDMPAHIKSSLLGSSVTIPITKWQTESWYLAGNLFMRTP